MANISITYDRSAWEARLGGGADATAAITAFLADITTLNAAQISLNNNITVSFTDSTTGSLEMTWASPAFEAGFDFNTVLSTDWGRQFLAIFSKHNLNFHNS